MKIISWNVNGLRACKNKGFDEYFQNSNADIFCLQETKMQEGQCDLEIDGYFKFMNSAEKKGYSGTLIYSKIKPISVKFGIEDKYNDEGRIITLEFDNLFLVNVYVPNSQEMLKRLDYRMEFEDEIRKYLTKLSKDKSVVYCGDLNVAHEEIDIKNPKSNERNAGFSIEERNKMTELIEAGFFDSFRYLYPTKIEYSWWSYRFNAREKNIGWRLDYFILSNDLKSKIKNSFIDSNIMGSDHAPIVLELD